MFFETLCIFIMFLGWFAEDFFARGLYMRTVRRALTLALAWLSGFANSHWFCSGVARICHCNSVKFTKWNLLIFATMATRVGLAKI